MRLDRTAVRALAKDFDGSPLSRLWNFVTNDVRQAIVDSIVMGHVRSAWASDVDAPVTPTELLELRAAIVDALAAGIPHGTAGRIHYCMEA